MASEPRNYYDQSFADSIDSERTKLLKLLADHGAEGAAIYDEAQARAGVRPAAGAAEATGARGIDVPETLIAEVRGQFDDRGRLFNQLLTQAQDQSEIDMRNRAAAGAVYKDSVAGDDTLRAMAEDDLAAARAVGSAGGGGGRGRAGRSSAAGFGAGLGGGAGQATLPAGLFLDQLGTDPEGLLPVQGQRSINGVGGRGTAKLGGGPTTTSLAKGKTLDALKGGLSGPTRSKAPVSRGTNRTVDGKRVYTKNAARLSKPGK